MNDPYSILGVSRNATDDEVKNAYRNLARKYHPDNYADDNPLKDLAKEKMQEINAAYDEIQRSRANGGNRNNSYSQSNYNYNSSGAQGIYINIRQKINERKYAEAERMLEGVAQNDRTADWHFLSSVCLFQRRRPHDAMRELEIACSMDPSNMEYQKAKEMFNGRAGAYGSTYYNNGSSYRRSNSDDTCDCCMKLWCLDSCCECMGGDLINCC